MAIVVKTTSELDAVLAAMMAFLHGARQLRDALGNAEAAEAGTARRGGLRQEIGFIDHTIITVGGWTAGARLAQPGDELTNAGQQTTMDNEKLDVEGAVCGGVRGGDSAGAAVKAVGGLAIGEEVACTNGDGNGGITRVDLSESEFDDAMSEVASLGDDSEVEVGEARREAAAGVGEGIGPVVKRYNGEDEGNSGQLRLTFSSGATAGWRRGGGDVAGAQRAAAVRSAGSAPGSAAAVARKPHGAPRKQFWSPQKKQKWW